MHLTYNNLGMFLFFNITSFYIAAEDSHPLLDVENDDNFTETDTPKRMNGTVRSRSRHNVDEGAPSVQIYILIISFNRFGAHLIVVPYGHLLVLDFL